SSVGNECARDVRSLAHRLSQRRRGSARLGSLYCDYRAAVSAATSQQNIAATAANLQEDCMAQPTTARFGKFKVMLGDGGSPMTYAAPCGFTSKSLTLTKNLTEVNLPDCDDPDSVAWVG